MIKKFGKEMFAGIPAIPAVMPEKKKTRQEILLEQLNKKSVE